MNLWWLKCWQCNQMKSKISICIHLPIFTCPKKFDLIKSMILLQQMDYIDLNNDLFIIHTV